GDSRWSTDAGLDGFTEWNDKQERNNMPLQMPHVSMCDSHNSLPQSEHCVLAVLEQGSPSSSAEFLTSMISQRFISNPTTMFWPQIERLRSISELWLHSHVCSVGVALLSPFSRKGLR